MNTVARSLLALACLAAFATPAAAQEEAPPSPELAMAAGILVDGDGNVLWAREEHAQRPPASLTKIVTALVVLERANLDDTAVITPDARAAPGGRIHAEEGWTFSVRDLLWALLLPSGNDAAVALAQKASPDGTVPGFVALMNERAAALGATATSFVNPHGMDEPGHLSTARDLALLTTAALGNPTFAEIVATARHEIGWPGGTGKGIENHNRLLVTYPGAIGVKTGFTSGAGRSLAAAARRDGVTLVSVALGSPETFDETARLLDWGFGNYEALSARPLGRVGPAGSAPAARGAMSKGGPDAAEVKSGSGIPVPVPAGPGREGSIAAALAALGATVLTAGLLVRRRRRLQRTFASIDEFQGALQALGASHAAGKGVQGD